MKRISTATLTAALVLAACSGDGEPQDAAAAETATRSVASPEVTTTTTTTTTVAETTTTTTTVLAPSTLAFTSSDDVGRLFVLGQDVVATTTAGGTPDASAISAGTIVQSSNLRNRNDVLWVLVASTELEGPTLGWVRADDLRPTTESVFYQDDETTRELRQVSSAAPNDQLSVFVNPGAGSPIRTLVAEEFALHGGGTALSPSGDFWRDVIDPETGTRIGWVEARFLTRASGEIQDENGNSLGRSPIEGVNYGQALAGDITLNACNAVQITFSNASPSAGIGVVFGTTSPVGRELNSGRFDWSGTSAFSESGADVVITIPTSSAQTWFFAPLDSDGNANFSARNADGFAVATGVVEIPVPASGCVPAPIINENRDETILAYIDDLPEADRLEALAAFEASRATAGAEVDGAEAGDEDALADGEATDGTDAETAADQPAELNPATPETEAPVDPATTDPATTDPAATDPATTESEAPIDPAQ